MTDTPSDPAAAPEEDDRADEERRAEIPQRGLRQQTAIDSRQFGSDRFCVLAQLRRDALEL